MMILKMKKKNGQQDRTTTKKPKCGNLISMPQQGLTSSLPVLPDVWVLPNLLGKEDGFHR